MGRGKGREDKTIWMFMPRRVRVKACTSLFWSLKQLKLHQHMIPPTQDCTSSLTFNDDYVRTKFIPWSSISLAPPCFMRHIRSRLGGINEMKKQVRV